MRRVCSVAVATVVAGSGLRLQQPVRGLSFLVGAPTAPRLFDIKQHEKEKRRLRELEKAGIDPEDDEPWIAPEEQARIDEEEAARKAEEEERLKAYLAKRDEEDAKKREKFKQFRAKQVAMSKERKEANAQRKAERAARRMGEEGGAEEGEEAEVPAEEAPPKE